jgi:site-specific recombinase XerD
MRVQRVIMPGSGAESWTLLADDGASLEPAERFLAYLSSVERSPNTVRAYAHDLKDWFSFLQLRGVQWKQVTAEEAGSFVAWLRLPPRGRDGTVAVLPSVKHHCGAASVNRKLAALTSFCQFHARHGVELGGLLTVVQPRRPGSSFAGTAFRPFLHHVTRGRPQARRAIKLAAGSPLPQVLAAADAQAILDACEHLRDRLLLGLLLDTGMRIGEALGLRHEDMDIGARQVQVLPRENANGARAKSGRLRVIPCGVPLMRLYADYLNREYLAIDCDYVFVNLWGGQVGRPLRYRAVYDLVVRLRHATGIDFSPHSFRHTYATWLLRRGAGVESVKELLGHASVATTIDTYGHLTVEDARRMLEAAGWFTGQQVRL